MLVGYVSDERYVALADVLLEFRAAGQTRAIVRSTPRGAVEADLAPGEYEVTLVKQGYGSKHSRMTVDSQSPISISPADRWRAGICLAASCEIGRAF